ncbi:MAG: ornithine carbamoyltransferase [Candidatus Marsarchaeota archaeon]|nr:ornithine carbamoyltransferase [Candidatus Marsarchaeota archaeon]
MDFLKITDITPVQLREILTLSAKLKADYSAGRAPSLLDKKTLLMLFEKNSSRTRVSFETAMAQLGGHAIFLDARASQTSRGETYYDTGAALGGMADFIMARLNSHADLEALASGAPCPVINGLTDLEHPCQILADLLTLQEKFGELKGRKLAYVGDCDNNVAHSLMLGCAMMGMEVSLVGPKEAKPKAGYLEKAKEFGANVSFTSDVASGVSGAGIIYTDTWVSMGDEKEAKARLKLFAPYSVNSKLMACAKPTAIFMHCLPAHRGEEVGAEVLDGAQSAVFQQANNRLHAQKGLLVWLASKK